MNGVHDMGGMTCFGPIVREENEPVFHANWERRVFGMALVSRLLRRYTIERMDPVHYLSSSYYEHWLAGVETLAIEKRIVTPEELASGVAQSKAAAIDPPLPPEAVPQVVAHGAPSNRTTGRLTPQFQLGDRVKAKNLNPTGHTRLPRYVRGKVGVIDRIHGTFVYPDTNAHGLGEQPQPLYCVRFDATELWGPSALRNDSLYIDLWEDYLERA
ncbi:MAG: nitrile hydratase subunit beta [Deltaproteobacteria bacterium]|nr:nitrile hydratase subunit beta [Deltaproteobacteria bacterium]